ncbi:hypothetical protein VTJ04DRAFT_9859 [Mycothermus thermophilus]|uniref:uncharacterized protein n=1 Tax=Humicola insolens TaxID=85995 RepID=UPI0037435339
MGRNLASMRRRGCCVSSRRLRCLFGGALPWQRSHLGMEPIVDPSQLFSARGAQSTISNPNPTTLPPRPCARVFQCFLCSSRKTPVLHRAMPLVTSQRPAACDSRPSTVPLNQSNRVIPPPAQQPILGLASHSIDGPSSATGKRPFDVF